MGSLLSLQKPYRFFLLLIVLQAQAHSQHHRATLKAGAFGNGLKVAATQAQKQFGFEESTTGFRCVKHNSSWVAQADLRKALQDLVGAW